MKEPTPASTWYAVSGGPITDELLDWPPDYFFPERAETPLEQLVVGRDPRVCEALLTLHAIADEACAGLGVALDTSDAEACIYRARGRELLARTGSLARINPSFLRVLPKVSTPPDGTAGVFTLRLRARSGH